MKGQLMATAVLEELHLPKNAYLNEKIDYLEQTFNSNSSLIIYGEPTTFKTTIYKAWKQIRIKNG